MALNDIIAKILILLGIKKSGLAKLEAEIALYDDRVRSYRDKFNEHVKKIQNQEERIQELKREHDRAHGAVKETYAIQIKTLVNDLIKTRELRETYRRHMEQDAAILRTKQIAREALLNSTTPEDIDDAIDLKKDILQEMEDKDKRLNKLEALEVPSSSTRVDDSLLATDAPAEDIDALVNSALGVSEKKETTIETSMEKPLIEA